MAIKNNLRIWMDARTFRKQRANYYRYLSNMMRQKGGGGRIGLRDIFQTDAHRYAGTPRGRLSAVWAERYDLTGGDLASTFAGTLPRSEVGMLDSVSRGGGDALATTLEDIASITTLVNKTRKTLVSTSLIGIFAIAIVVLELFVAIPYLSVPYIEKMFSDLVSSDRYGPAMSGLTGFADFVRSYVFLILIAAGSLASLVAWSVPNYSGSGREKLDRFFVWNLYRETEGIRVLSFLAAATKKKQNVDALLRDAVASQMAAASPWLYAHLERMVDRIDDGSRGIEIFQTGAFSKDLEYMLDDLIRMYGLSEGVQAARGELEGEVLAKIGVKANVLRGVLLGVAIIASLGIYGWHVIALWEMNSLMPM